MTFREAVAQSFRELGVPEDRIIENLRYADKEELQLSPLTYSKVRPGKERDLVDYLKRLFVMLLEDPKLADSFLSAAAERTKKHLSKQ